MRNCPRCKKNKWTFSGEDGMVICTCACGHVISFKSQRKKRREEYVQTTMTNTAYLAKSAQTLHEVLIRKAFVDHGIQPRNEVITELLDNLYKECFPWLLQEPYKNRPRKEKKEPKHEKKVVGLYPQEVATMKPIEYYLALAEKKMTH